MYTKDKKIIGITADGVLCADGKVRWVNPFARELLKATGLKGAYYALVLGAPSIVYKGQTESHTQGLEKALQKWYSYSRLGREGY